MTEKVRIPLDNPHVAAAVYLAVLAFPERTDWRDDFLLAVMAAAKQPRINARRIAAIDRVGKRLAERMSAIEVARPVLADAALRKAGGGLKGSKLMVERVKRNGKVRLELAGPLIDKYSRQLKGLRPRRNELARKLYSRASIYKVGSNRAGTNKKDVELRGNLLGRAWKRSLPVLHMALAFANHAPDGSVLALIRNPDWIVPTVKGARVFAAAIRRDIPTAGALIELA